MYLLTIKVPLINKNTQIKKLRERNYLDES